MFPDYVPPEELQEALSQAAIVAADIDPENRLVQAALHSEKYIPMRLLDRVEKDICSLYGLHKLILTVTHPEEELHKIEPEELMQMFVSRNSMSRGTLAGAQWNWDGYDLTVKLVANGKDTLQEHIPVVQNLLRERFACPVTITVEAGKSLEGKALFEAMESMREELLQKLRDLAAFYDAGYSQMGEYPAWEYKTDSALREKMVSIYTEMFGKEPKVVAIHAGLECGLLSEKLPGLDCVAIGPQMHDIHTSREKLEILSTERTWKFLLEVLKAL